jgi:hypothetical protein
MVLFGPGGPQVKEERLVQEFCGRDVRRVRVTKKRGDGGLRGSNEGKGIELGVLLVGDQTVISCQPFLY